ncbi:MlaE family ABC transporter permease [Sulfurospirillum arcachonense]|uniref:MlaE family ABC transporter permease n=1 Tax=Sulfurospirillum arcachonense TaxID=57666 RepID=UPI000468ECBD|nr:ABC transporter permease [Sulfurospirillum arcachonense]
MIDFSEVDVLDTNDTITYQCKGPWTLHNITKLSKKLKTPYKDKKIIFDFSKISDFDTHGILLFIQTIKKLQKQRCNVSKIGETEKFIALYQVCEDNFPSDVVTPKKDVGISVFLYNIGKTITESKKTLINFFSFVGGLTEAVGIVTIYPLRFRLQAMFYHIENSGIKAIPIILLTSFLIGIVIAFQGAVQLEKFGANIFIVEMVSISVTRELAPLLTAIVIAGRSASAYTAQIGVMKITEEIDAMKTMGFSVWDFLIIPRVFGLMISLPLIVFFADIVSIFGGMVVANFQLGISFEEFALRMQESVEIKHVVIGLIKAPIFGWIIAVIGCFRGFQISSSTESVGKYTTISVVNAIFWVIAMDAIISVLLTEIGL